MPLREAERAGALSPRGTPPSARSGSDGTRAVIYARVSQDPRQQLRSVSQQIDECSAECARRGWTVSGVFRDNDRSASRYATKERPEYARLLAVLESGGADVLVTWESSRAQRDLAAYLRLRGVAEANGVRWCYKGRLYDLSRTDDRFTTGLDALLDERESSITRDRILRDKRANALKGRPNGAPLFGYRREYDPASGVFVRQVPCEVQAPIVREAFRRYAAGEAAASIVRDFNARGLRTNRGNEWCVQTLQKMVTWPSYLGKRIHQGVVIGAAVWPAIIDEPTFHACVERRRIARRPGHGNRHRHLLSGLVTCGVCGTPHLSYVRDGVHKYVCRPVRRSPGRKAGCTSTRMDRLDPYVTAVVLARLARPDAAELYTDDRGDARRKALAEAAAGRARLEEVYDRVADGSLSAAACAGIEARLLPEIRRAEERAERLRPEPRGPGAGGIGTGDITRVWAALPLSRKRAVIRALLDIVMLPERPGSRRDVSKRVRIVWKEDDRPDDTAGTDAGRPDGR